MNLNPSKSSLSARSQSGARGDQMKGFQSNSRALAEAAFTMVEVAISIAIVAFAMVALLGVLPTGHQVQRENREDTIINQDATYLLQAIRSGSQGLTDLSNYVDFVSITSTRNGTLVSSNTYSKLTTPQIITLLSTPKSSIGGNVTNIVTARLRAITGNALEKPPANLGDRDFTFRYLVTSEIIPFLAAPPTVTNGLTRYDFERRRQLANNLSELRLAVQWPVLPNGQTGRNRRVFRTLFDGHSMTNKQGLYYQPSTYSPKNVPATQ
jgi:type II secretory pathway pseudopilin PulG